MSESADSFVSAQDKYVYKELFKLADDKNKLFLSRNEALAFFSSTGIPTGLLEEIWQTVDKEQKEYITELEFYQALKLIACTQHGIQASENILLTQAPLPQFTGIHIKPKTVDIAPITPTERDAYIGVFQNCNPTGGILQAEQAIELFNRSGLSVDHLRNIWELADTRKSGTLNKTEFIIAMHYIARLRNDPQLVLPTTLPSHVYAEATGRFNNTSTRDSPVHTFTSPVIAYSRVRASSDVSATHASPAITHRTTAGGISIPLDEKEKSAAYFKQLDADGSGYIDSEEAVYFFSHSQLPDSELGMIWEIADSRQLGKLDLQDFTVAMYLINKRLRGESIETYVNTLSIQQQDPTTTTTDLSHELENQLMEIKQQLNFEQQRFEDLTKQQQEEQLIITSLENDLLRVKSELAQAKSAAEKAEANLEQTRNKALLMPASSTPELTRTPSVFSGTSALSPRNDDPFLGFNNKSSIVVAPLSPQQSKAISKYGFDLTAFDTLSNIQQVDTKQNTVQDELASLFGPPPQKEETQAPSLSSEFDSIFLK